MSDKQFIVYYEPGQFIKDGVEVSGYDVAKETLISLEKGENTIISAGIRVAQLTEDGEFREIFPQQIGGNVS